MSAADHLFALRREARLRATGWILAHRVRARHPTLICHPTAIWDYAYRHIDSINIGQDVSVGAFAEILVYRHSPYSAVEGRLVLGDRSVIAAGVNLRAAGGEVRVGADSAVSQNSVVVAANHRIVPGLDRLRTPWDETRCGVIVGRNVWIGAACVLLPGCSVGDGAVVGAGSVVAGHVPPHELWAGVPARRIRALDSLPLAGSDTTAV